MELSRHRGSTHRGARFGALIAISCIGLAAAACGSSSPAASGSSSSPPKKTGTANVAYASSLQFLNEKLAGPAFTKAEGYQVSGRSGASGDLEADIELVSLGEWRNRDQQPRYGQAGAPGPAPPGFRA